MICSHCGSKNRKGVRFCANCGAEFQQHSTPKSMKVCPVCGIEDPTQSHLESHRNAVRIPARHIPAFSKRRRLTAPVVVAGCLAILAVVYRSFQADVPSGGSGEVGTAVRIASFSDRVTIVSQFHCPCGNCKLDNLSDCSCDHPRGAKEVKAFIDDKIAEGKHTVAVIVATVEEKYGARKF